MKSLRHANSRRCADVGNGDKTIEEHFMAGLKPGDVTWVKLLGTSWWPAQVMDENTVSRKIKPRKRISSAVLVRLYGSYKYVYVDPMKSLSEFENILKQHNGSYREIIRKSLKRDLSKSEPGISKTQPSNSKSIGKIEVDALRKELKQSGAEEKAVLEVPISMKNPHVIVREPTFDSQIDGADPRKVWRSWCTEIESDARAWSHRSSWVSFLQEWVHLIHCVVSQPFAWYESVQTSTC